MPCCTVRIVERTPTRSAPAASTPASSSNSNEAGDCTEAPLRHSYDALIDILANTPAEEFYPYPMCSLRQLRQVHTFFVAYAPADHDSSDTAGLPASCSSGDVMGFIGIVWVNLSTPSNTPDDAQPSPPVEGYLQVVLVPKRFRQHGVAGVLLKACLATYAGAAQPSACTPRAVRRWRLHTMRPTAATLQCLEAHIFSTPEPPSEDDASPPSALVAEREKWKSAMNAVTGFYEKHGFAVRRYLARYYADAADAVEMVLNVDASSHSKSRAGPASRKRSRSCA